MATVTEKTEREGSTMHAEETKTHEVYDEVLSPEEDKRLLRRIDMCLLPVMGLSYMFQFLDKTALNSTAILGLREDLHLTGEEYSWSSGIYYFGYLAASYPAAVLMVRWHVGKLISASVFFLGFTEAAIGPGLTVVVAMWYKRAEQPLRHAAWYLGNTFAGIFGGLLANAIGHIDSIAPWKAVFLIFGGLTIAWSFVLLFTLPDTPGKAWFLNRIDREKALVRVKENMTGIKNNEFKWSQCLEALLDIKSWFVVAMQIANSIPNGAVTTFSAIIIRAFGFSTMNTLLLTSINYVLQLFLVLTATIGSSYFNNSRTYWMAGNLAIAVTGAIMVRQLPVDMKWGRLAGICMAGGYAANFPLIMSLMSGNFGGFTKKTTVNAMQCFAVVSRGVSMPT
ncbi:putative vitamin H transporter [Metarhizium anisopliae]|nr:putative vitamin H transporter [Metarhizium anisopliae]